MLAENLKKAREKTGLTQVEVAKMLGITQVAYSHYESERKAPTVFMLRDIAKVLQTTTDELLK